VKFIDLPQKKSRDAYDEAIAIYRRYVGTRVVALFRVGNISFPGLSDLDLLIILSESCVDNNQFFAYERLPRRYHGLFLHQPFFVPSDMTAIIDYTTHSRRELVAGTDVLVDREPTQTLEARECRFLESFCHYRRYVDRVKERGFVSARMLIAVASAFRYSLADGPWPSSLQAERYAERVDEIRGAYFAQGSDPESRLIEVWQLLCKTVDELEIRLNRELPLQPTETAAMFAQAFVAGQRELPGLRRQLVLERRAAIDAYHQRLKQLRLSYGHIFYVAAYAGTLDGYRQSTGLRRLLQARYKPQHVFDEVRSAIKVSQ